MKFLTAEDVKWKGEKYYSSLKSKWNKDQYGIPWQGRYAGKPSVGAMVHLCNEWKPESYEHFFNLYINDKTQTTAPTLRGRSLDELEDIAIRWQKDSGDYETPLSEYFDAIILHTIIETYVGVDFEKKAISCLEENGYRVEYGNVEMRLTLLREEIEKLDEKSKSGALSNEEVDVRKLKFKELWRLWKSKETLLFQRSRSKWLKEGDANSKFFHCSVRSRAHRNEIKALKVDIEWVFEVDEIRREVVVYFKGKWRVLSGSDRDWME